MSLKVGEKETFVRCYIAVVSSCREVFGSVQVTNATHILGGKPQGRNPEIQLETIERKVDEVKSV